MARDSCFVIVTNDLDFPQILAHTRAEGPSVILMRGEPLTPEACGSDLIRLLREYVVELTQGASNLLVQQSADRYGHCNVKPVEILTSFQGLFGWVNFGIRPFGGDITVP